MFRDVDRIYSWQGFLLLEGVKGHCNGLIMLDCHYHNESEQYLCPCHVHLLYDPSSQGCSCKRGLRVLEVLRPLMMGKTSVGVA